VSAATIIIIVVVLVILAVAAAAASMRINRRRIEHHNYGPEYERLVQKVGARKADAEFARRRQRVDGLGIRSLSDERRTAFTRQWDAAQEQFIDSPAQSVGAADSLVKAVAAERGYQTADDGQLLEDLSIYHGRHLDGYRGARQTAERTGQVTTEGRRRALLAYRSLFFDLLEMRDNGNGRAIAGSANEHWANEHRANEHRANQHGAVEDRTAVAQASADQASIDQASADRANADEVPPRPAWKQVTQGMHWKTQRAENGDVPATRR
jgi:hypothetical protein